MAARMAWEDSGAREDSLGAGEEDGGFEAGDLVVTLRGFNVPLVEELAHQG